MDKAEWQTRVDGVGCPMDVPRPASNEYWDLVARLAVSSLYLAKNQTYLMNELKNNYRGINYSELRTNAEEYSRIRAAVSAASGKKTRIKVR